MITLTNKTFNTDVLSDHFGCLKIFSRPFNSLTLKENVLDSILNS